MSESINYFTGGHRFLSNFWYAAVELDGKTYPTVEHAYQAAKTDDPDERETIRLAASPGAAKRLGRRVTLRADWEEVKLDVMRDLVRKKFRHLALRRLLLATGDREIVEGNHWGDTFWGQCPVGEGFNHLGRILMDVRAELRRKR